MRRDEIASIQVLRGLAALAVVVHHAARAFFPSLVSHPDPTVSSLAFGVDVFFVISGFIMVHTSDRYVFQPSGWLEFYARRWIRIWPLYALLTLAYVACRVVYSHQLLPPDASAGRILASLLFIPHFNVKDGLHPVLGVGWTLDYEMFFYAVFALALLLARGRVVLFVGAALVLSPLVAQILPSQTAGQQFFANRIALEFLFGCILAKAYHRGLLEHLNGPAMLLFGLVQWQIMAHVHDYAEDPAWRFAAYGLPALLVVAAALKWRAAEWTAPLVDLGGASYALYIAHTVVLYNLFRLVDKAAPWMLKNPADQAAICLIGAGLSVLSALVIYRRLELPLTAALNARMKGLLGKAPSPVPATGS